MPHIDTPPARQGTPTGAPGLLRRRLFRDRFICFLHADHPALRARKLSLDAYARHSHVLVSPRGEGPSFVDQRLAERGIERRIAPRIPAFYSALRIVGNSDLILTGPAALAGFTPDDGSILALPAPLALPTHSVNLVWHERFTKDPGHSWLRTLLAEVSEAAMRDIPTADTNKPAARGRRRGGAE